MNKLRKEFDKTTDICKQCEPICDNIYAKFCCDSYKCKYIEWLEKEYMNILIELNKGGTLSDMAKIVSKARKINE